MPTEFVARPLIPQAIRRGSAPIERHAEAAPRYSVPAAPSRIFV